MNISRVCYKLRSINREILRIVTPQRKKRKSQTREIQERERKGKRDQAMDGGKEKAKGVYARVTENGAKCGRESACKTLRARLHPLGKFLKRNYVPIEMSVSWK